MAIRTVDGRRTGSRNSPAQTSGVASNHSAKFYSSASVASGPRGTASAILPEESRWFSRADVKLNQIFGNLERFTAREESKKERDPGASVRFPPGIAPLRFSFQYAVWTFEWNLDILIASQIGTSGE